VAPHSQAYTSNSKENLQLSLVNERNILRRPTKSVTTGYVTI